jgi:hypothetical protein
MVIVSPWVTVILGLGTPVLFQALMNPTRLILGVEAASTPGGMLTDAARSEASDKIASMKPQNLLLVIRTHDHGRRLLTLSNIG